ncbi:hypothetical protein Bbelb_020550 [Branchiostoma belcheri]|nr:hypothetical protein Bbelb_020550 [Branchiostoma belcheri]
MLTSANKKLYLLRRLKRFGVSVPDLKTVYTSYVRPALEYAAPAFGSLRIGGKKTTFRGQTPQADSPLLFAEFYNPYFCRKTWYGLAARETWLPHYYWLAFVEIPIVLSMMTDTGAFKINLSKMSDSNLNLIGFPAELMKNHCHTVLQDCQIHRLKSTEYVEVSAGTGSRSFSSSGDENTTRLTRAGTADMEVLQVVSCKLLEHIMYSATMKHRDDHHILFPTQHGFRANHSCVSQADK